MNQRTLGFVKLTKMILNLLRSHFVCVVKQVDNKLKLFGDCFLLWLCVSESGKL